MIALTLIPVSAVVPSLLLIWYFHARDLFREPARVLWATFGLGVVITVPVIAIALPLSKLVEPIGDPYLRGLTDAFVLAAIPEEIFKFLVIRFYCARHREFDEPMDGIVYGAAASLGFATLENVLYVTQSGVATAILRALTAVPNHAFLGALMGYWIGQARFNPTSRRPILKALAIPMLLHGLYDFPLLSAKAFFEAASGTPTPSAGLMLLLLGVPVVLVVEWIWVVKLVRRLRRDQLALLKAGLAPGHAAPAAAAVPDTAPRPARPPVGEPPPSPAPRATGAARFWGWFLVVIGALHATGGGLTTLGGIVGLAAGQSPAAADLAAAIIGLVVIGIFPLAVGVVMFGIGLRLLNRGRR